MKQEKVFRNNGAIGALLDEYEYSILALKNVIAPITGVDLLRIVDTQTKDVDCVSVQSILSHVIQAGYNYVIEIRHYLGENIEFRQIEKEISIKAYQLQLDEMFRYNVKLFKDYPLIKLEESKDENKITVKWGQKYDVEQLFEHAIVHILRHRRQIERFRLKLDSK